MAFDLNKLKNKQVENNTMYISKFESYLESEEFEDRLQEYLENEIDNNRGVAKLALVVQGSPIDKIKIRLSSIDMLLNYILCDDVSNKIGDLKQYTELIENKLDELKISYKTDYPITADINKVDENTIHKFEYLISLNFDD